MLDASTVVSAALPPSGVPRRAIAAARAKGIIALSDAVHREIAEVLARPKFARVLTDDRRREILTESRNATQAPRQARLRPGDA